MFSCVLVWIIGKGWRMEDRGYWQNWSKVQSRRSKVNNKDLRCWSPKDETPAVKFLDLKISNNEFYLDLWKSRIIRGISRLSQTKGWNHILMQSFMISAYGVCKSMPNRRLKSTFPHHGQKKTVSTHYHFLPSTFDFRQRTMSTFIQIRQICDKSW